MIVYLLNIFKIKGLEAKGKPLNNDIENQWNSVGVHTGVDITDRNGNPILWQPPVLIDETANTYGPHLDNIEWEAKLQYNLHHV